jgi:hypothetical protein
VIGFPGYQRASRDSTPKVLIRRSWAFRHT